MSEEELRKRVMEGGHTEPPFSGIHLEERRRGFFSCAGCGNVLFSSDSKFDSGCGWPSFDRLISDGAARTRTDLSHGMVRAEVICARCGSHLGHVFEDGPTATGVRFCINSIALDFTSE